VSFKNYGVEGIYCDLRRFSDFVRSIDLTVEAISLRPGDRESLRAAIAAIEKAIDEQAQRPPRHPATRAIARDLKETRRAVLVQRFEKLGGRENTRARSSPPMRQLLQQPAGF